tara:strand:- start:109 stop:429 length:321 start_codon:yes stop_codon:yes gene_type:complete
MDPRLEMTDVVVAYIAGKEMARGRGTKQGHVMFNQQTYQNITDFYNDTVAKTWVLEQQGVWTTMDSGQWTGRSDTTNQYNACYKTTITLRRQITGPRGTSNQILLQ